MWFAKGITSEVVKNMEERSRAFFELVLPAYDMYELSGSLVLEIDLPGFSRENIDLKLTENTLTVFAKRQKTADVDATYVSQRPLRIRKRIRLPVKVDTETEPEAKYENGVLSLTLAVKGSKPIKIQ